jgi:pSer/pThr/pTyr-binding forkhead associated (FHA) protein
MVMEIQIHRCPEPSCSFFNQVLPHNAKICPMCGSALGQALQSPSRMEPAAHYSQPPVSLSPSTSAPNRQTRPQLKFLHPSQQSFILLRESGVIGRQNIANGTRPDIDLTDLPHAGVISRVHAHIYWDAEQEAYMIVDDSRNGSYLNDKLLARGAPHPLKQGDKLQLGQERLIYLQVELNSATSQNS